MKRGFLAAALPFLWLAWGCGATFCPDQPHGWCAANYNQRITAINKKMAGFLGSTQDEVSREIGQPFAVSQGANGERVMLYLFLREPGNISFLYWPSIEEGGPATNAESSRISRSFILNTEGVVARWAWRGFTGCEECWGDSTGCPGSKGAVGCSASWKTPEPVPEAIRRDRKRAGGLTDP